MSIDHGTVKGLGHNLKYTDVPTDVAMKPENLYVRGVLSTQVLDDIDAAPTETRNVTHAVQVLFDDAPGFVKQLRKDEGYRSKIREQLRRLKTDNPVHQDADGLLEYVWITVKAYSHGVPYHGRYYKRSGGTTRELIGAELNRLKWPQGPIGVFIHIF